MQILAYAKINLTLDLAGKRADGYHLLRMVMQSVSLCDRLELTTGKPGIRVTCSTPGVPCDRSNTAYRAAELFFAQSGGTPDVEIQIEKNIPSQAGLGGGSADAAAVLHGLNLLYRTGYSEETLRGIGLRVGADVPFCLLGGTALAEGIGEELTPLPGMPHCFLVICKPPVGVNTGEAYAKADLFRVAGSRTDGMIAALEQQNLAGVAAVLGNNFEQVVALQEVEQIEAVMRSRGALGACMTGSGSAVFGIFTEKSAASACKKQLEQEYRSVFLCEPVSVPCEVQSM
ncbi:MAG: 4-(cytidine 5'-diphospho)-2-C-methyl-D-erythritol kinase [Ruminococcaceae bacterium]|nr:4-(cytidine 5'-diphospho)-2-C-methyl-D-erythritol kinase [Oscillospiraceae bacterium]HHV32002.1 4-(cytidine 5'-diphospho)-2-C-methyl-D-erythritol kinase [Clostridiales bacterium]